jgi:hypothetical protein
MATSWGDKEYIWSNAFTYLNANDVGKCMTVSSRINDWTKQHFRQVLTTVQIVQHNSWGKPSVAPPFDGRGIMVSSISAEKKYSHNYTE